MNRRAILNLSGLMLVASALTFASFPAWAAEPTVAGVWEFNVAKSTSSGPWPKSQTRTYEATALQEKMTANGIDAQGKPTLTSFTAGLDGKDYPYLNPVADMIALSPVDALTNSFALKSAGKIVVTGTRVLNADGKMMTITSKGTNAAGQSTVSALVFDRR
jgi:hypothetical protein